MKLKRICAGSYLSSDGKYYAVRMDDNGWWSVGEVPGTHIADFKTLRESRQFINEVK